MTVFSTLFLVWAPAQAQSVEPWLTEALELQEDIDRDAPISQALWIGTHNSFNSSGNGVVYFDPNQKLSLNDQLDKGVREVVFDVHAVTDLITGVTTLLLCHGAANDLGCSGLERTFLAGIRDIKDWVVSHPDDVIMLKIETFLSGHHSKFANELDQVLGVNGINRLYKPVQMAAGQGVCQFFDQANVSKADILAAGKNVFVLTAECERGNTSYSNIVFSGVININGCTDLNAEAHKFVKIKNEADCLLLTDALRERETIRAFDNNTEFNIGGVEGWIMTPDEIEPLMNCGLNIFEMFWYATQWDDPDGDSEQPHLKDAIREKLVWSWDKPYPNGSGECAFLHAKPANILVKDRFRDDNCNTALPFACRKAGAFNEWHVTTMTGAFAGGEATCLAETNGKFVFAAPRNKYELNELVTVRGAQIDLWVNYAKRLTDGTISVNGDWTADIGLRAGFPEGLPIRETYECLFQTSAQEMWGPSGTSGPANEIIDLVSNAWNNTDNVRVVQNISVADLCVTSGTITDAVCNGLCDSVEDLCKAGCLLQFPFKKNKRKNCKSDCKDDTVVCKAGCVNVLSTCVSDFFTLPSGDFGAGIEASTSGLVDLKLNVVGIDPGDIDVTYPVRLRLGIPDDGTYNVGEEVTIDTSLLLRCGLLETTSPGGELSLDGRFKFITLVRGEVCFGGCTFDTLFDINVSNNNQPIIVSPILRMLSTAPSTIAVSEISGSYGLPDVITETSRGNNTVDDVKGPQVDLLAKGAHKFMDIAFDIDAYIKNLGNGVPALEGREVDEDGVDFEYTLLGIDMIFDLTQDQKFKFNPTVKVELDLSETVSYKVFDFTDTEVASGTSSSITMDMGGKLKFNMPPSVLTVTPTFSIKNEANFLNETTTTFTANFDFRVVALKVIIPDITIISANSICIVNVCLPEVKIPGFTLGPLGPLFATNVVAYSSVDTSKFDSNRAEWSLQGFAPHFGAPFDMVPDLPPTALCQDVSVFADGACQGNATASDFDAGSSDANGDTVTLTINPSGPYIDGQTVTLTALTPDSQSDSCTATITVVDNTLPAALCQNVTVELDSSGNGSAVAQDVNNGSNDACGAVTLSLDKTAFGCADVGSNTVTLTVTDVSGNSSTCDATVTVNDNVNPMALCQNVTVELDGSGNGSIVPQEVDNGSSDACGVSLSLDTTSFSCADVGANTVTLTVTDGNGNSSTCDATVTVNDNVGPAALCQSVTVDLDSSGNGSTTAQGVNNGSNDACGAVTLSLDKTAFGCADVGSNTVTLTVTDVNGNSSTCNATVTVNDVVDPAALCQDVTVDLDASGNGSIVPQDVDNGSSDACGISTLSLDTTAFTCADVGANTVTLTATDVNGNSSTCNATVTVNDIVNPVALCRDVTVQLDAGGNGPIGPDAVDNGSSDECGVTLSLDHSAFGCTDVGTNPVTLTATDATGNSSTCSATVTVEDNVDPVALCQDITVELDASGNGSIVPQDVDNGSSDACEISTLSLDTTAFTCADVGANTVTLTATDVNGNSSTCNATVTVNDNVDPVALCRDVAVQLDDGGNGSIVPQDVDNGSSDACGVGTLSLDNSTFGCADVGSNTVILTVTDVNGNSSTCNATVTVSDNVAPVAFCRDVTVELDETGSGSIVPQDVDDGSSDACGISLSLDTTAFNCADVGANMVTLTVTDASGNSTTCDATITVVDNIDPEALCRDVTVVLDASGNGSIVHQNVDNGSSDACGISSVTLDNTAFNCADLGENTVTLTATDVNGNSSLCDATVTVVDNESPVIDCPEEVILSCTDSTDPLATGEAAASDNCELDLVTFSDSGSGLCPEIITRTWTATDSSGNGTSCDQFIIRIDPDGGFVTGGGRIWSDAGYYVPDPTLVGTAKFAFVSKYKKGANVPIGNTEFQFQVADLNFHSKDYQWLVVAGHTAKFKGTGTINGAGYYGFMISAVDEKLTLSVDDDSFRIKIWDIDNGDGIVYDNQPGDSDDADATNAILSGSIVIHK